MTLALCILDGLGLNPERDGNAVELASTPTLDRLLSEYPSTTLITHGERVGLPEGQMGNSEVGHLNIGAGRIVEQWLVRIRNEMREDSFADTDSFRQFTEKIREKDRTVHCIGLASFGGVHSHLEHLARFIELFRAKASQPIAIHIITDGRDTAPTSALQDIDWIQTNILDRFPDVFIASVSGRYFAMDRDQRWERVQRAFDGMVHCEPKATQSPGDYLAAQYESDVTDEFMAPVSFVEQGISQDDFLLFWNFRADRMREIVSALTGKASAEGRITSGGFQPIDPDRCLCFTSYDEEFSHPILFPAKAIDKHLGQVVGEAGLSQYRSAETEKYPHVTYFLSGGEEEPIDKESRALVPSPRDVATYDLKPEMSAPEVCEKLCEAIRSKSYDLIVVNFANCDMVGHTGNLDAAIKAVETVDGCLAKVLTALEETNSQALIFADHGNAEMMRKSDGSPHTAHTTFPVPCILVGGAPGTELLPGGALCDIAPTALSLLKLPVPEEMTGRSLLR